jgi:hypothetical protein
MQTITNRFGYRQVGLSGSWGQAHPLVNRLNLLRAILGPWLLSVARRLAGQKEASAHGGS